MDGNKRWAEKKNSPIIDAYSLGIDNILRISEKLIEKEIKYLSVYALSTENLKRKSINILFDSIFDKFSIFFGLYIPGLITCIFFFSIPIFIPKFFVKFEFAITKSALLILLIILLLVEVSLS